MSNDKMNPDNTAAFILVSIGVSSLSLADTAREVIVSVSSTSFCESVLSASITFSNNTLKGRSETDNHLNRLMA